MNGISRSTEIVAENKTIRAVYYRWDMGYKGRIQQREKGGRWITTGYYSDFPELMLAYHKAISKMEA